MIQMMTRLRHRSAMHEDMESALYLSFTNARAQNIIITDDIIYYEKRLNVLEMNWVLQNSDIQTDGRQDLNRDIAFHAFL